VEETPAELLYRAMLPCLPQYMVSRWPSSLYIVSYDKATVFYCRPGLVKVGMIRFPRWTLYKVTKPGFVFLCLFCVTVFCGLLVHVYFC